MPSLREIQREISRYLLGGPDAQAAECVAHDRLEPARRLQIYRNHLRISLREALAAAFPVVARLVGPDYFAAAARRFVESHPPRQPVLTEYGAAFPDFLVTLPNAPDYLRDVARLEWAINESAMAPEATPLTPDSLASIIEAGFHELPFDPHPATRLVVSAYPIDGIWRANQPGSDDEVVDLGAGGAALLIWRRDGEVQFRRLSPAEHRFVAALVERNTIGRAAASALDEDPYFDLSAALAALLREPIFAELDA